MTAKNRRIPAALLAIGSVTGTAYALSGGLPYTYAFQHPVGAKATFHVSGPATGSSPDVQGDAMLNAVEYPNGEKFVYFYKPASISGLTYTGDANKFSVRGGSKITQGVSGTHKFADYDDSKAKLAVYQQMMLDAFNNSNLNSYVDISGSDPRFSFVIGFDLVVKDDNPKPDDFGELLYFERGSGSGNSWLKMRAVEKDGTPLGPWLVVGPAETVQTTPETQVYKSGQKMGTTSIDVSRLGVAEFQYLEVTNDVTGEGAYLGGGDLAPDFKLMAVMTNKEQLKNVMFD